MEETATSGLGTEYRAAKLGQAGLEKIVSVLRLSPALSGDADMARGLMDQIKVAAQLHSPNIVRIYGIGRVESSYYISYEFIEGKSMQAIMERCARDGFPFSVDHTLLIASKICSALEYVHGRKTESGARYFHGLLNTAHVIVSYEGEVRVAGFGYGHSRIREAGVLRDEETLYLAPEQAAGAAGDTKSDIFAVGAILYESLTGEPLFKGGRADPAARIAGARLQSPTGDDDSVPKPIADILARSLAPEPARRYAEIQEMRKAVDTLLFSGDFTPTTFNLAFFMHSLFREDIERESKQLKDEREASYLEFLAEDLARAGAKDTTATVALPTPILATDPALSVTTAATIPAAEALPPVAPAPPDERDVTIREPLPPPSPGLPASEAPPTVSASAAASVFTFHKEEPAKSRTPLLAVAALLIALAGATAFFVLGRAGIPSAPASPVSTTLSPAAVAAMTKVKELEEKLQVFEAEKAAAEAKAAEEAKKKLESQAKNRGQEADPVAVAKAQEEAAAKARAEQEKKQQEERRKLEEAKAAEEARLAEEERRAEETRVAALATTTTTLATPPPTTLPPLQPGALVDVSEPGVLAPVVDKTPPLQYPQLALRQRVEGTVELNVLVDEKGLVTDATVVKGAGKVGLDEAAIENVKKRRYRPATKDGVPVKVWIPVRVQFRLPS